MRKFSDKITDAGWVIDSGSGETMTSVGIWLYSYSVKRGSRLVGQLTTEGHRAMKSGELLRCLGPITPVDALAATIDYYDSLRLDQYNQDTSRQLVTALAAYASATKTFKAIPHGRSGEHQHFVVVDWLASQKTRILRPAAVIQPDPLTPAFLTEVSQKLLAAHLSKWPKERPV